ncbi:hypothetical protein [Methyloceanibacter sp.]|uniref:hypothetical protein n=1 Tax=Methyloceanibacter sp. TaxID=1965321 RepID=UPI003C78984F
MIQALARALQKVLWSVGQLVPLRAAAQPQALLLALPLAQLLEPSRRTKMKTRTKKKIIRKRGSWSHRMAPTSNFLEKPRAARGVSSFHE